MVRITWKGLGGWVRPGLGFELVEHTGNRWHVYVCGDRHDLFERDGYPTVEDAMAAAEANVDALDDLCPWPPPRQERRRPVANVRPKWAPHPGTLREPPA
jgi:hypothetical protein